MSSALNIFPISSSPPSGWKQSGRAYSFVVIKSSQDIAPNMLKIFGSDLQAKPHDKTRFLLRHYLPGVSNPVAESLARVLKIPSKDIRVDLALELKQELSVAESAAMEALWKEPAIERLAVKTFETYCKWVSELKIAAREDDSFDQVRPEKIGLEFSLQERAVLEGEEKKQGRVWNRAEWELFAQTWSEHCKHKIFNAELSFTKDQLHSSSLFKSKLRAPALKIAEKKKELYLSLFHDNAGVIRIYSPEGKATSWAIAAKMETHNSPSAISPYGGASTGIVGVHRDILGTGLGALPIANWDVLCFENPGQATKRPDTALSPEIIRKGVLRGIQDGGNQSGIPTVQGSVVFDPCYAVKPLVYAGALGILPIDYVNKKAQPGDKIFVIGGATGADGLRGAVMSSRDLRSEDFAGSIVQVANPYTQRCLTDFLIDARDRGLLSAVTDNGAGGLASSVGEMSTLCGGARIDLSKLRLKFDGLLEWEKLMSESQERMTLATSKPDELKKLLAEWRVEYDELGELNKSGRFIVSTNGKTLVDVSLEVLHDACPQLNLTSTWSLADEQAALRTDQPIKATPFAQLLASAEGASREGIIRRFDHEVQGRTLRKPFGGRTQESPQEGSLLEIFEASAYIALGHGLAPQEKDFFLSILNSFDEAMKRYVLATGQLAYAGLLDNFCWPDPLNNPRSLWKLQASCDLLKLMTEVTDIPFVSGKDSMKNNDAQFRILETLVISAFGSARGPSVMPTAFFLEESQKVYNWKALECTALSEATSYSDALDRARATIEKLYGRYQQIETLIATKKLLSAKDYSAHCPLKSLFEMSLGRRLGLDFESTQSFDELSRRQVTLGAFHLVFAEDVDVGKLGLDLEFVGATRKEFCFDFNTQNFDLEKLSASYKKAASEGLWA